MVKTYYPAYDPSEAVAILATCLFGLGLAISLFQTLKLKAWIWLIMCLAIAMETVGYAARILSTQNVSNRDEYILQFTLVVLAPVIMAGIIYVAFGRVVFLVVPPESRRIGLLWVPARWLTPMFVFFDIFALFLQLIGAVIIAGTTPTQANASSKLQNGKNIALAGVSLQITAFGFFSIVAIRFHFVSRRFRDQLEQRFHTTSDSKFVTIDGNPKPFKPHWEKFLYSLNVSCGMILVRSIYREIDFAGGTTGYPNTHEWCAYVFDAIPMFILVVLFTLTPPGYYVNMGLRQPKEQPRHSIPLGSRDEGYA